MLAMRCVSAGVLLLGLAAPGLASPPKAHHAVAQHAKNNQGNPRTNHPNGHMNGRGPSHVKLKK
jgi:hypothetical protein